MIEPIGTRRGSRGNGSPDIRRRVFLRLLPSRLRYRAIMLLLRAASPLLASARELRARLGQELRRELALRKQYLAILYSGAFDRAFYRSMYPDAGEAALDPIWHFVRCGAEKGHDPSPLFSTSYYLRRHVDVAESGQNPLAHYILHGRREGRQIHASGGPFDRPGLRTPGPLRMGYFLYSYPALSQTFVMAELRWLSRNGFDVVVYFAQDPDTPCTVDFDIPTFKIRDVDHLATLLIDHDRTLCHSHFIVPAVSRFLYPACRLAGIPFTFMPHAADIFAHSNRKANNIAQVSRDPLCKRVFVYGDYHRRYLEDCGVPREKIAYNFQAVDLSELAHLAARDARSADWTRKPVIGVAIARFVEKKGIDVLIRAAAQLRDVDVLFEIYGYGPLRSEYAALIEELGLTNVGLKGPITPVADAYRRADFLVVPSVVAPNGDMDGFPTVILEAMAAGRPVIASAISAVPDYLTDADTSLLVPPADVEGLADAVRRLIVMPATQRAAMCCRATEFLRRSVGTAQTMKILLDVWLDGPIEQRVSRHI